MLHPALAATLFFGALGLIWVATDIGVWWLAAAGVVINIAVLLLGQR